MSAGACELRMVGDRWVLTGDPYVLHRAEKAIPFSESHKNGSLSFPATEEIAVELMWLQQRFPFHCRHEMLLRRDAAKHNLRLIQARGVMNGKYDPSAIQFRDGMAPREYQMQAALLWRSMGGLLCADSLGVGKTATSIAGIASPEMMPALIVCPSNLCYQWKGQIERFLGGPTVHIIGRQKNYDLHVVAVCKNCGEAATSASVATRRCAYCKHGHFKKSLADVYIISYGLAHFWAKSLGEIVKSVTYDECQELRLSTSKKYEACKAIGRKAAFRLGLSATPVFNWGGEIYNIIDIVCPGKLGSKSHFRETWCGYSEGNGKEPPLKNPDAFGEYLKAQNLMIRRTREDVGRSIPSEQRIIQTVDFDEDVFSRMTKDAKELARVMLKLTTPNLKHGEMVAAGQFERMMYQATGIAKAPHVANFVEILLESGEPVMLFGYHRSCYEIWCRMLRKYNPLLYTGSESRGVKEQNKQAFMAGESNLLICSIESGVGLDGIQDRCHVGVFGELSWSPARLQQNIGRYHRDGQSEPCMTYMMVSEAGIDPYMIQTLSEKKLQVDGVVHARDTSHVMDSIESAEHLRLLAQKFLAA